MFDTTKHIYGIFLGGFGVWVIFFFRGWGGGLKTNHCNYISINFLNSAGLNTKFDEFFPICIEWEISDLKEFRHK